MKKRYFTVCLMISLLIIFSVMPSYAAVREPDVGAYGAILFVCTSIHIYFFERHCRSYWKNYRNRRSYNKDYGSFVSAAV